MKTSTRTYRMAARADAVASTRQRILQGAASLGLDELNLDPTLEEIARRAGVSVQTVLRHFGTRDALLTATVEFATERVERDRRPEAEDPAAAVDAVVAHYEQLGDFAMALLAREPSDPRAAEIAERGKATHRRWVEDSFAAELPADPEARAALVDLLVVATDVYAWKLLRRDRRHPVPVVRERMLAMVQALLANARAEK